MTRYAHLVLAVALTACSQPQPNAGLVTAENMATIVPPGDTAGGRPGDYYLRNAHATFILQRPGREIALGPYGGSLIDAALAGGEDRFGELIPVIAIGRTIRVESMRILADGSGGEPAAIEAIGYDAVNVYYNLQATNPELIDSLGLLPFDPNVDMHLKIRIVYKLAPDEARLSITYTIENIGTTRQPVPLGLLVDARGSLESFASGAGFTAQISKSIDENTILQMVGMQPKIDQLLYTAPDVSIGVLPRRLDTKVPPDAIGAQVPQLGGAIVLEARSLIDSTQRPAIRLDPKEKKDFQVDVLLAPTAQQVLERGWDLIGKQTAQVSGCVKTPSGTPVSNVRVGYTRVGEGAVGFFETDAAGCFEGRLPPGEYTAIAGAAYRRPSDEIPTVVPGHVELTLEPLGQVALDVLTYNEIDSTTATREPCRLTLAGEAVLTLHPALNDLPIDAPGGVVARQAYSRSCNDAVSVPDGRYLAIVTRGPEFDKIEQIIEVKAGETSTVKGILHRVVDTRGWAASDFHVHSVYSPDSSVAATDRVLSLATEGMDFWASTDHDVVTDYNATIRSLGLANELATVPGSEVTTFDLGHFGAYPLPVNPGMTNGGAPDWAMGPDGVRPTMAELFSVIHGAGALVQVNHPRGGGLGISNYFSRAGLHFDLEAKTPLADRSSQRLDNAVLRYPEDVTYFSDNFDIIEVMNGINTYISGGMVYDRRMEGAGHDWMNFLDIGRRIVGVANSDTHTLRSQPGSPRTMVGGHDGGPAGILGALARGQAVMTTGPMLRAWITDASGQVAGIGETLTPASAQVILHIEAETPTWYSVDRLEVLANTFYADSEDLTPARPFALLNVTPQLVERPNGGQALVVSAEVPLDVTAAPFSGNDSWVIVRAAGPDSDLFPVLRGDGELDVAAKTPEDFLSARTSGYPYAATNPVFLDVDHDGSWH